MARVNVYLPDELAAQARTAGLNVSAVTQAALRAELSAQRTSAWVQQIIAGRRPGVRHDRVIEELDAARRDTGDDWPEERRAR